MPLINEKFATEMRAQIARKQLSSGALASELGLSASQVSRLLGGRANWSLETAARAAEWAGLNFESILLGRDLSK